MIKFYYTLIGVAISIICHAQTDSVKIVPLNVEFGTITKALDHLKNAAITQDITIELKYSLYDNEKAELNTFGIALNGHHLTIQGTDSINKSKILMDGTTTHVLQNGLSNFTVKNLILEGADPNDLSGAIFRQGGNSENILMENVELVGGYCGVRATTKINNLTFKNIRSAQVTNGTFRLGNGDFSGSRKNSMLWERDSADFDMWNLTIENITMDDDLNGGNVPGTTKPYNGFFLLKNTYNLSVENVHAPNGNGGGIITVENSKNVGIHKVKASEFGFNQASAAGIYITKSSAVNIANTLIKCKLGDNNSHSLYYLNMVDSLVFVHNTAIATKNTDQLLNSTDISRIQKWGANIFHGDAIAPNLNFRTINNYQATFANDLAIADENIYISGNQYSLFNFRNIEGRDYLVVHPGGVAGNPDRISFSDFVSTSGKEFFSMSAFPFNSLTYAVTDSFYLGISGFGRHLVQQRFSMEDINGNYRALPTDPGAYHGDNYIGTNEVLSDNHCKIYPNPTNGLVNIILPAGMSEIIQIKLWNLNSQLLLRQEFTTRESSLQLHLPDNIKQGLYLLEVESEGVKQIVKLRVE